MKTLSIKAKDLKFNKEVLDLAKSRGFTISNPDQVDGDLIDLIIKGKSKLAGFNLIAVDSIRNAYDIIRVNDTELIEDWITDHETSS